jgi:pyruvate/2-oxoglutarate dehydrogenase complex dihydrolipoamide acyltransferase (E2) component
MQKGFEKYPFPALRKATFDLLDAADRKHMIHGLLEVDISCARELLKQRWKSTGELGSVTSFIIFCCAKAVSANKRVHAYRSWKNQVVEFDDVDVSTTIEKRQNGEFVVVPVIIRGANKKTVYAIDKEIHHAKQAEVEQTGVYRLISWYVKIPFFIRRLFFKLLDRSPAYMKKRVGTVMVTSVGMFTRGAGWGVL